MRCRWSPTHRRAPRLKRYQVFGNLFAVVDGVGHRLDRHPTMSRHPVTPMGEADLRLHLGRQTSRPIELIDMVQLRASGADERVERLRSDQVPVVMIDVLDQETGCRRRAAWSGSTGALASSARRRPDCSTRWPRTGARAAGSPRNTRFPARTR
jgi:uncharacterized protein YgbK (DUF1537 family)